MQNPRKSDTQNGHQKTKVPSPLAKPTSKNVKLIPPDGEWGWIIIFATCITLMVLPTAVTCFGVIVPFILRDFESANIANVSWIPGIAVAVLNLAGPWVSAMLSLYSHRRLAAIGSVIMVASIIGSSFAESMMVWYLTYGLLLGFGCSLSHVMGLLITQEYFLERRHLANGLAMAGGSVGQMLIPLVMQSLFEGFGLRGGLLIYSGVVLHALVAAMLFQPSRWHYKIADPASPAEVELLEKAPTSLMGQSPRKSEVQAMDGRDRASSWTPDMMKPADVRRLRQLADESRIRSVSVSTSQQQLDESTIRSSQAALNYLGSMGSLGSVAPAQVQDMPANLTLAEMRGQLKTRNNRDTRPWWLRCVPRCPDARTILNLELLKDPVFLLMSGAMGLGRLTYQQFNVLVPSFAQENGIEPTMAASLVTILASSDTVARLAVPILSGKLSKYVSSLTVCLVEFLICGIGSFGLALSTDFTSMAISCVIYGIGIGGITGLTLVVIVQSFGMDQLTAAFGLNVFIGGIIVFPGIIIIGYIQVLTKSFPVCFYIVGGICGVCILLWAPLNWMLKRRRTNESECVSNPLQRELADKILRFSPLDDLRILLACGASPNDPVTQGLRPLHYAVWQHYAEAVRFLLVRGSDVDARDDCGYTAMHLSAEHGFTDIMQILLEFQAKVNFTEDKGRDLICDEPLHLAIKNGHFASAQLLLENGANVNARYFFGCEINLISPLNTVAMQMLLMYGADPDSRDRNGLTPLMKACRLPQRSNPFFEQATETVLLLLHYGADVNATADERNDYRSVLHFAVLSGNHAMVNLLIKQGARPRAPPGGPADRKPSALDLAVLRGDVQLVQMLIEAGADVNHTSSVLGSALHVACTDHVPNRLDIVRLLLESGADPNIVAKSDEGLLLQPVLAEYVTSNSHRPEFQHEVVRLLLRHGAQVVLKTQHRHPLGIYSILPMVARHPRVFVDVIQAAEGFDPVMLKRSNPMPAECKQYMMHYATQPASLCHQVRVFLRRHLGTGLQDKVPQLDVPGVLHSYLLFDIS